MRAKRNTIQIRDSGLVFLIFAGQPRTCISLGYTERDERSPSHNSLFGSSNSSSIMLRGYPPKKRSINECLTRERADT